MTAVCNDCHRVVEITKETQEDKWTSFHCPFCGRVLLRVRKIITQQVEETKSERLSQEEARTGSGKGRRLKGNPKKSSLQSTMALLIEEV